MAGGWSMLSAGVICVLVWLELCWRGSVLGGGEGSLRISCPGNYIYPCSCHPIKLYPRRAVVENRLDCSNQQLLAVPDMTHFRGYPLSQIILLKNNISAIGNREFEGITLMNVDSEFSGVPVLDLSGNPLVRLQGDEFLSLNSTGMQLKMNNCHLKEIPYFVDHTASALLSWYLQNNQIKTITEGTFRNCNNLQILDLTGNHGVNLLPGCFQGLDSSLQLLYLEDLGLTTVPSSGLRRLRKLVRLHLGRNRITQLGVGLFDGFLTRSLVVFLEENEISRISPQAFRKDPDFPEDFLLKDIILDANQIENLDFLEHPCSLAVSNTTMVSVAENPIRCDCKLFTIAHYKVVKLLGDCGEPSQYTGNLLDWRTYGDSQAVGMVFRSTLFPVHAAAECGTSLASKYFDCRCGSWVELPVNTRECPRQQGSPKPLRRSNDETSKASCHCRAFVVIVTTLFLLIDIQDKLTCVL